MLRSGLPATLPTDGWHTASRWCSLAWSRLYVRSPPPPPTARTQRQTGTAVSPVAPGHGCAHTRTVAGNIVWAWAGRTLCLVEDHLFYTSAISRHPASARLIQVFGLDSAVSDNVCFVDEQTLVYPAGTTLVIYNIATKEQRFINGAEGTKVFPVLLSHPSRPQPPPLPWFPNVAAFLYRHARSGLLPSNSPPRGCQSKRGGRTGWVSLGKL